MIEAATVTSGRLDMEVVDGRPAATVYPNKSNQSGYFRQFYTSHVDALNAVHDDIASRKIIESVLS